MSAAGYDLVWFGIIFTITMEIAVLTPPVGLNLYVLQGLAPRDNPVPITDVIIGCVPFIIALAGLIILMLAFPQLALWLPEATALRSRTMLHHQRHGSGPPLVLQHGFLGGAGNWLPLFATFGRHFDVIASDFPGSRATGRWRRRTP